MRFLATFAVFAVANYLVSRLTGGSDDAAGWIGLLFAVAVAVAFWRWFGRRFTRSRSASLRGASAAQFVRQPLNIQGDLLAHRMTAAPAYHSGDFAVQINVALDIWDRFGFGWDVGDILWDGFLAWQKVPGFDPREAYYLAISLFRRARSELPSDLSMAPQHYGPTPPIDPVSDWLSLFNLAKNYKYSLNEDEKADLRNLAGRLVEELMRLPDDTIYGFNSWISDYIGEFDVGDQAEVEAAIARAFQANGGRPPSPPM